MVRSKAGDSESETRIIAVTDSQSKTRMVAVGDSDSDWTGKWRLTG